MTGKKKETEPRENRSSRTCKVYRNTVKDSEISKLFKSELYLRQRMYLYVTTQFQEHEKVTNKSQPNLQEPHASFSRLSKKNPKNNPAAIQTTVSNNGKT